MAYKMSSGARARGTSGLASFGDDCPEGMVLTPDGNSCVLDKSCPSGQTWDASQAVCVPVVAPPSGDCPQGMTFSAEENGCVMAHGCSSSEVWSVAQRKCVPKSSVKPKNSSGGGSGSGSASKPTPPDVNKQSIWDGAVPLVLGGAVLIGMGMLAFSAPESKKAKPNRRRRRRA